MGADWFDGIIEASSLEEAIKKYETIAPCNPCDYFDELIYVQKLKIKIFEKKCDDYRSAIEFLSKNVSKWDDFTGIIQINKNEFVWGVLLPS